MANIKLRVPHNIPSWVLAYEDAVNTDAYTVGGMSVPEFRSKCSPFDISIEESRLGVPMRVLKFGIQISREDMRLNTINMGFREIVDGKLVNITNDDGTRITVPALLNGFSAVQDPTPADREVLIIEEDDGGYAELPFAGVLPGCN